MTLDIRARVEDIRVEGDTDNTFEVQLFQNDGVTGENITNDTIKITVRTAYGGTIVKQVVNSPGSHSTPLQGKTRFKLLRADLAVSPAGTIESHVYEVRRIIAATGNEEVVYIKGRVLVEPPVGA